MKERLDSLFTALAVNNKAMGSICISDNGKVIYSRTTGYSVMDEPKTIPATESTKYRIASITKMFTAAIIFQLIQEGKIDFANTLDEYFPGLPGANKISIAMLLAHRSGLHNILDDPDFASWKSTPMTREQMLKMIGKYPLEFAPDSKAAYSNSNYILLGYIIEDVCHKPYSDAVRDRIISKLGLKNTYYGGHTNIAMGESYSYAYGSDWIRQPEADMSILAGAGALVSTPEDLIRFIEALYARHLFKPRHLSRMQAIVDGYGMGMFQFAYGERVAYGHAGSIDGFNSQVEYFPDDKLAIAYCSNGMTIPIADVLNAALAIVFASE
jgi:CubicO group peptidase (beta-lactamase class C family)